MKETTEPFAPLMVIFVHEQVKRSETSPRVK